jgi:hypothetical protein
MSNNPLVHYLDNGNGTITDMYTKLIWQSKVSENTYTWKEALAYVNALNACGGYANETDWRLPDIKELFSLVDVSKMAPCIDGSVFDVTALFPYGEPKAPEVSGALWSSTSMFNSRPGFFQAWDLHDLFVGIVSYSAKTAREHIILVRGGIESNQ